MVTAKIASHGVRAVSEGGGRTVGMTGSRTVGRRSAHLVEEAVGMTMAGSVAVTIRRIGTVAGRSGNGGRTVVYAPHIGAAMVSGSLAEETAPVRRDDGGGS
jgi:hypothetical protein